jgi:hypothetical protein
MSVLSEPDVSPRRDQGLEVAVARIGGSGGRAAWAVIAWTAALVTLVGVAIAGRPADIAPAPVVVSVPRPHADPGPTPSVVIRIVRIPAARGRTPGEDGLMGSLVLDLKPQRLILRSWPVGRLPWLVNPAQS